MPRAPKRKTLVRNLDIVFSRFVRLRDYDVSKMQIKCITCTAKKQKIKDIHNGHFMSRRFYPTRWHEDNCAPQCAHCNTYSQGQQYLFSLWLGHSLADEMYQLSKTKNRFTDDELKDMIAHFKERVKYLETTKFKGILDKI